MFVLSRSWIHRPHERHLAAIGVRYIRIRKQMSSVFPLANRTTSLALVVRVALFNVYSVITLGYVRLKIMV